MQDEKDKTVEIKEDVEQKNFIKSEKERQSATARGKTYDSNTTKDGRLSVQSRLENNANGASKSSRQKTAKKSKSSGAQSLSKTNGVAASARVKKHGDKGVKIAAWLLIALAAAILLVVIFTSKNTGKGIIKGANQYRYGETNWINLNLEGYNYRDGDTIEWLIDDKQIQKKSASDKSSFALDTSSTGVGLHKVKALLSGKEIAEFSMTVNKPLLKIRANDASVVYGEKIPAPTYTVEGLVDGDTVASLGMSNLAESNAIAGDGVGDYEITFRDFQTNKYDVDIVGGTLKILPRELTLDISNKISKEYDGTDYVKLNSVALHGGVNGDSLALNATAKFSDKNAGESKNVVLEDIEIVGSNSKNYTLKKAMLSGTITPKTVTLKDIVANDKIFDGTTNVTFERVGKPDGVLENDSVAVGEIMAAFVGVKPSNDVKVEIYNVTLVGKDSKNYLVEVNCEVSADIISVDDNMPQPRKINKNPYII